MQKHPAGLGRDPELVMPSEQLGVNDQAKVIGNITRQLLIGFALVQRLPLGFRLAAAGAGLGLWRQVPHGKRLL